MQRSKFVYKNQIYHLPLRRKIYSLRHHKHVCWVIWRNAWTHPSAIKPVRKNIQLGWKLTLKKLVFIAQIFYSIGKKNYRLKNRLVLIFFGVDQDFVEFSHFLYTLVRVCFCFQILTTSFVSSQYSQLKARTISFARYVKENPSLRSNCSVSIFIRNDDTTFWLLLWIIVEQHGVIIVFSEGVLCFKYTPDKETNLYFRYL